MPDSRSDPLVDSGEEFHHGGYGDQMQRLVESVPDGLCLLDEKNRLLIYNDAGRLLLDLLVSHGQQGQPIEELGGRPLTGFLDGERHEITLDGPPSRQIVVTAHPVLSPETDRHNTHGWVLVLRDVTERHRQAQLSREQERLAAVGQLAAGIAHDFNNILSSILLYAQMLGAEPQLTQDGRRRLQVIHDQTKRASELVRQLLDFSRRSVMERSEVDLAAVCRQLVAGWRRTLPANIEISLHLGADSYVVSGDASRLQQALLNLTLNAQEAMPRGGRLALTLTHRHIRPNDTVPQLGMDPGLWLQLTVVDSGAGIAPEALPHVFEPFFSTKPLHEGAGLGLPQVYGIVRQHGGHIKIDSESRKGTIVTMYLPLQKEPAPDAPRPAALPGHRTILVIEENEALRKALADALHDTISGPAYHLALAASGKEALTLAQQQSLRPDLIVGDLAMPHMSGLDLLQSLRTYNPRCRMIVISSYPVPSDPSTLRAAGIIDWLPKPFAITDLARRIEKLLEN